MLSDARALKGRFRGNVDRQLPPDGGHLSYESVRSGAKPYASQECRHGRRFHAPLVSDHCFLGPPPIGRAATPDEVAGVIAFLASEDAIFIDGVNLPIDGGLHASNGQPNFLSHLGKG
jgi:hypothetical protein